MRSLTISASALAVALLAASCSGGEKADSTAAPAGDPAQGVSDDAVVVGTHQPLSGAASPGFVHVSTGARAVFDYVNDNGGVHGRRIEYVVKDDAFDPVRTQTATGELLDEEGIFAMVGGLGTRTHEAVIDELNDRGVPDLFVSSGALSWDQPEEYPYSYGFQPDYTREAKVQARYIAENLPGEKVGLLYQNDDVGPAAQAGIEQYLTDEVVAWEAYDPSVPELGGQIAGLQEEGADVVVCSCIPSFLALALMEAAQAGYEPQWVAPSFGGDAAVVAGVIEEYSAGTPLEGVPPAGLVDGLILTSFLPLASQTDDPWIEFYREVLDEYAPEGTPFVDTTVYGMVQATLFARLLVETGPDLDRAGLLETLHSHDLAGPGLVPFAATEEDHAGYTGVMVARIRSGQEPEILQGPQRTDRGGGEILDVELDRPSPDGVRIFGGEENPG
ncbi:ABC transporter substrate-binding protein [Nocardiopsis sp. CNT312]|uniref:ABC transporter substrate-binding protein n=1 Tax=Nocardiopsis sp. CNT312 TaxID=1137268 RepID=UPI000490738A|nr:ABC transporter substrate-binding protein [Nocardiopsis sp. CNT312]